MSQDREQWRRKTIEWSSAVANRHRRWSTSEWVSEWSHMKGEVRCSMVLWSVTVPGVGLTPVDKPDKDHLSRALSTAQSSTASMGKFDETLPKEKPAKQRGKKRKVRFVRLFVCAAFESCRHTRLSSITFCEIACWNVTLVCVLRQLYSTASL